MLQDLKCKYVGGKKCSFNNFFISIEIENKKSFIKIPAEVQYKPTISHKYCIFLIISVIYFLVLKSWINSEELIN